MCCKTRNLSMAQQGLGNKMVNFGILFETALVASLCYIVPLNYPFGTRMIALQHFTVPSFPFFAVLFFYDEARKIALRAGTDDQGRYKGWVARNTSY